jgi:hypothetical protein
MTLFGLWSKAPTEASSTLHAQTVQPAASADSKLLGPLESAFRYYLISPYSGVLPAMNLRNHWSVSGALIKKAPASGSTHWRNNHVACGLRAC